MGQKVHPYAFRLGYIKGWGSNWFARKRKDFAELVYEDKIIRNYLKKSLSSAAVSKIDIDRAGSKIRIVIHSARPGIIIGRRGAEIDRVKEELASKIGKDIFIDIAEVKNAACDAQLVAENVALQLTKRIPFRRAMKKAVEQAMNAGAEGMKIRCKGRLGGAEIARTEWSKQGKIPLQTIRADIDYGFAEAFTTYGAIGIKVWICKGDALIGKGREEQSGTVTKESKIPQGAARPQRRR